MELGEHAGFIIAGYLLSFVVLAGVVVLSVVRSRRVHARIAELEAQGVRRRSDRKPTATAGEGSKA